jgi:tetratricopeptide (TPR) repeat protein
MRNATAKKKPKPSSRAKAGSEGSLPAPPAPEPRSIALRWWPAVILTVWSFGFTTMQGSDLWWHLAGGRWIVQTRTLHFTDPFSFTCHGRPWFHPEWLTDVIFHAWATLFSTEALVWWKWGILVATFALLFRLLRQICGGSATAYLATLAAIAVGAPFLDIRPQLYTFLGFVVVLSLALPLSRRLWILPLVFMLWANLHSGFLLGLVTITAVLAISFFYGELPRRAVLLVLACLLACFVNGNGSEAILWPIRFAQDSQSPFLNIAEWLPPYEPGGIRSSLYYPSIATFVLSLLIVLGSGAYRRQPRLTLSSLAIGLVTLVLSIRSRRFIPLFGIAQSLLLAPALVVVGSWLRSRIVRRLPWLHRPRIWPIALPVAAVLFGAFRLAPFPLSRNAFFYLTALDSFPVEAMNLIEANHLEGKVFDLYNWGGYIDWRTDGRLQVFIDGRAGTAFDEKTYRQYLHVLGMYEGWEEVVWASGADFVLWPQRSPKQIEKLRKSGRWLPLYSDHVASLLVRAGRPSPQPLLPTPDSPWRDLTLGWSAMHAREYATAEGHFQRALQRMPNLRPACEWLANVQSETGRLTQAKATLDRCQRIFPDAERRQQLLDIFHKRAGAPKE